MKPATKRQSDRSGVGDKPSDEALKRARLALDSLGYTQEKMAAIIEAAESAPDVRLMAGSRPNGAPDRRTAHGKSN